MHHNGLALRDDAEKPSAPDAFSKRETEDNLEGSRWT